MAAGLRLEQAENTVGVMYALCMLDLPPPKPMAKLWSFAECRHAGDRGHVASLVPEQGGKRSVLLTLKPTTPRSLGCTVASQPHPYHCIVEYIETLRRVV